MQEQLAAVVNSLEDAQGRLRRLSDKVSEEAWSMHPEPGKWSAADCVEHLNITSRAYVPLLRDANTEARLLNAEPQTHYKKDAIGWFMTMMIGPMRHIGKLRLSRPVASGSSENRRVYRTAR